MRRASLSRTLLITLLLAVMAAAATAQVKSCTPRNSVAYLVRFLPTVGEWDITPPSKTRITNRDRVEVCIEHFNSMRYTLRFDISEERSQAYEYLAKLWTSVLNPSFSSLIGAVSAPQPGERRLSFLQQLQFLYRQTTEVDLAIGAELARYSQSGLSAAQAEELLQARISIASKSGVMSNIYTDLQKFLLDTANVTDFEAAIGGTSAVYEAVTGLYKTVVRRADAFVMMADKTTGIEVRKVGTRSPGTAVTLSLAALDEGGTATPIGDVHYFVETTAPLLVHGGIAFSRLRDVDFQQIKRAVGTSEEDLFEQRGSSATSSSITVFLAAQLLSVGGKRSGADAPVALLFSLGTDASKPGKKIFAGPSVAFFNRVILTAGAAFGKESHGEQATLEPNVFRIVRDRPKTALFSSLSIRLH